MRFIIGTLFLLSLFSVPTVAEAQRPQIQAAAFGVTGVSLGMGAGTTVAKRSATAVAVQVSGSNSERSWIRYGATLRSELEGKVTFGIIPQITLLRSWDAMSLGVIAGVPIIFAPRSLYGIEAGGSFSYRFVEWAAAVAQVLLSFYPLGNDLPDESFLLMVQVNVGIEFHF